MFTNWCYNPRMKRATMTLPDDLAEAVENYVQAQEARPSLTTVVQIALRQFLGERGFLRERRTLRITPAEKGSGRSDVSQEHDRYFAESRKERRR
jgi:Arc/MetJ-type ribon-helix-helix transcriptional regulator